MFRYDHSDDDRPLTERDLPSPKDVYDSYVDDGDEPDLGWMYDRRWTTRRILITALLLIALLALVAVSIVGVFELLFAPATPVPTLPPLPRV